MEVALGTPIVKLIERTVLVAPITNKKFPDD